LNCELFLACDFEISSNRLQEEIVIDCVKVFGEIDLYQIVVTSEGCLDNEAFYRIMYAAIFPEGI